ncbi:hypothetical protein [Pseudorhodoplanes sinuspersici]|uniref:hypothetical protein n=1 Tax=Pseudorhodoplanes sinuspersici TaxID=1235591 RepID=UPI0012FDDC40|nr:hypothetical protein [Pseudorhodoplanes sinuspersici]
MIVLIAGYGLEFAVISAERNVVDASHEASVIATNPVAGKLLLWVKEVHSHFNEKKM